MNVVVSVCMCSTSYSCHFIVGKNQHISPSVSVSCSIVSCLVFRANCMKIVSRRRNLQEKLAVVSGMVVVAAGCVLSLISEMTCASNMARISKVH